MKRVSQYKIVRNYTFLFNKNITGCPAEHTPLQSEFYLQSNYALTSENRKSNLSLLPHNQQAIKHLHSSKEQVLNWTLKGRW